MDREVATTLVEVGRDLAAAGLVTSHGGNLSARCAERGVLITATGAMLGRLSTARLVEVDAGGRSLDPAAPPSSSDTAVHLAVYAAIPAAQAVVHAHPVHAIALSFGRDAIVPPNLEGRLFIPRVPVLDVGWERSAEPVAQALRDHPIVVVRDHGCYAGGTDAWDALRVTSALEEAAQIIVLVERAGQG